MYEDGAGGMGGTKVEGIVSLVGGQLTQHIEGAGPYTRYGSAWS